MRAKNKWTPGGIALWLIAAVAATLIVCSKSAPEPEEAVRADGADRSPTHEVEVDVVE